MTNTEKLNRRIEASGLKKSYIAKALGMAVSTLSRKISNKMDFKASEIDALCKLLGIESPEEKEAIFFAA
jgi:transcriptional regulator with XRE-family HTH domain